ncbi:hypothetical protein SAMN05444365_102664 [Micromonospora pattaloongensis]|uniref:Uncharacterized protein n=1 Tax=Micromonospora pattaloongensis TaxID=405436 RepID=A0A1H3KWT3_9ACTN|nr:hypothetical protein [Micromonospora pattaloongensis]SDY56476.1 hypothetical protein SAMN05444365_102664 [Micromonospora pattaloongensis]
MSFDLVVWAMDHGSTSADVQAAHELCRQGEHVDGEPDRRIAAFYTELTAAYPDRGPAAGAPESPWAVDPLHVATDHVEMRLRPACADEVLLTIERLAGEHGLLLLDPQDGSVYPPPARV